MPEMSMSDSNSFDPNNTKQFHADIANSPTNTHDEDGPHKNYKWYESSIYRLALN